MERAFLQDEIGKNLTKLQRLRPIHTRCWKKVRNFLSFFDLLRFCRYLAQIESVKQKQIRIKHFNTVNWLRKQRFGISVSLSNENIINLSDYNLSETERYVLAHGLEFCLPPSNIKREEVFAEFEILLSQLFHHKPKTSDELILLKAKLNEVAHLFCGSPIDTFKLNIYPLHVLLSTYIAIIIYKFQLFVKLSKSIKAPIYPTNLYLNKSLIKANNFFILYLCVYFMVFMCV